MKEDPIIKKQPNVNGQKSGKSWKTAAAAGVSGAMMGAGAMFVGQAEAASAAESHVTDNQVDADATETVEQQVAETPEAATLVAHHQNISDVEVQPAETVSQEVEVVMVDGDDVQVVDSPVDADYQDADVQIVGTGEIDGHAAMALDIDGDGDADVAIIDVNDDNVLDADDIVVDDEGNMARYGDMVAEVDTVDDSGMDIADDSVAAVMEELVTDMPDDVDVDYTAEALGSPENPDMAPDMPDYMNDAMMDV